MIGVQKEQHVERLLQYGRRLVVLLAKVIHLVQKSVGKRVSRTGSVEGREERRTVPYTRGPQATVRIHDPGEYDTPSCM